MIFNINNGTVKVPVLDAAYPEDLGRTVGDSTAAVFQVVIAEDGIPKNYSYQWYVNDSPVAGATLDRYTMTPPGTVGTTRVYCAVTNAAGTVNSRTANLVVGKSVPSFTYTGSYKIVNDNGGNANDSTANWNIRFLTGGTLRFTELNGAANGIDVFCVGGGGGSGYSDDEGYHGGGGGGGYTTTRKDVSVKTDYNYQITVGSGGAGGVIGDGVGLKGGTSSGFGVSAEGGDGGIGGKVWNIGGNGGSGGGVGGVRTVNGGKGGVDGNDGGGLEDVSGGIGQHRTTREFGENGKKLYATGGDGYVGERGGNNTGDGGDSADSDLGYDDGTGNAGGSGIVIIRNAR